MKQNSREESYLGSIRNLCLNPGYVLLLTTYGMNVGVFYAISTLLNTTIVKHFDYEVLFSLQENIVKNNKFCEVLNLSFQFGNISFSS